MIYKLINKARDVWFNSNNCSVKQIIEYIVNKGEMRQAQIDAIKTYLFLKIKCENKPLWQLMIDGAFNYPLSVGELELRQSTKDVLENNKAAMALFQYSLLEDETGTKVFAAMNEQIRKNAENIDFEKAIKNMFKGQSFTSYLFSLPMGAGKTFLMASFIYLDLYFALNEPQNKAFAHNFVIFAPSGLKSSVVPSLKSIKNFDASWILPENAVKQIKKVLKFEVLEENKSGNKSNKTKNPNVQKIASFQPFESLIGLVVVTNAEKVILEKIEEPKNHTQINMRDYCARLNALNELKRIISFLPQLQVMVDEVHHLADENIKLNGVVEYWKNSGNMNCFIGFSGTPYYNRLQVVEFSKELSYKTLQIPTIVNFYPLVKGVETFLKRPTINVVSDRDSMLIIEKGLDDFFARYKDKKYLNGTCAKIAIYCGRIAKLREDVYQKCSEMAIKYGYNPDEIILCYHGADSTKKYRCTKEDEASFSSLDSPVNKKKIILLAQIGKEGWDCKSLTGVILSQEGDCPNNMVLQTSCRCLRSVDKGAIDERAIIWLNDYNAKILNEQLAKEQHTSIQEINSLTKEDKIEIKRYNRTTFLHLPSIEFNQFSVEYVTCEKEENASIQDKLKNIKIIKHAILLKEQNIQGHSTLQYHFEDDYGDEIVTYSMWLSSIVKESFGIISMSMLMEYDDALRSIFDKITIRKDGYIYLDKLYDNDEIKSEIRKAFQKRYTFETKEKIVKQSKSILNLNNFTSSVKVEDASSLYPLNNIVDRIIAADKRGSLYTKEQENQIKILKDNGMEYIVNTQFSLPPQIKYKDQTFHYLPYNFSQSGFEKETFEHLLHLPEIIEKRLEVYYIGDRALTEFKIKCYRQKDGNWYYVGLYTPDFLVLNRKNNKIDKVLIIETKGSGFANETSFTEKRAFVEGKFIEINNNRFDYFYYQDNEEKASALLRLNDTISTFFKEEK